MAAKKSNVKDMTLVVLNRIHDEIKGLKFQVVEINNRLEQLDQRQVNSDIRVATLLTSVAETMQELKELVREQGRARFDALEKRITDIERKVSM